MAARALAAAAVTVIVTVVACVPRVREPEVQLVGVRLGGLGLQGGVVYVELSVSNSNTFALVADGLTYDIDLSDPGDDGGWVDFAEGTFEDDFRVEADDTATVEIPVEFRYGGIGGLFRSIVETGTFEYRARGRIAVEEPLGVEIPYRKIGRVSVTGDE